MCTKANKTRELNGFRGETKIKSSASGGIISSWQHIEHILTYNSVLVDCLPKLKFIMLNFSYDKIKQEMEIVM